MVVFGFGRGDEAKSLLTHEGLTFRIGFWEGRIMTADDHQELMTVMESMLSE
jgi:hypothetical protein